MYIFAAAYLAITGAIGFQNFFPTLTATLGHSRFISLLLCAPPYIFMTIWSYIHGIISDRVNNRFWFFLYPIPISIAGFVLFMNVSSFGPKYFSFFLMMFVLTMNGTIYSWIAGVINRPPAKRAAAFAFVNSLGNSASIWTPYTYRDSESPYFYLGMGVCIGLQALAGVLALLLRWRLTRANRELARRENEDCELTPAEVARLEKTAKTEGVSVAEARMLQKGFRYML